MSLSLIYTRAQLGVEAPQVTVETHLSNGLPSLAIVGLPETAVKESRERVRSALLNSGFEFPTRRVTINLAPADLPKQGGRYDLAIAVGILAATGQIDAAHCASYEFFGELALNGAIRPVNGVLPSAVAASEKGKAIFVPNDNAEEAAFSGSKHVFGASHLVQVCQHILGLEHCIPAQERLHEEGQHGAPTKDLSEVNGQYLAKRALEIAAAGGHNLLFFGPPGTGKSMLAARLPGIMPPLSRMEALEVASIYSLIGQPRPSVQRFERPFRSPHHSASSAALVGGGSTPAPGEVSLAHRGVLFLDELPEFDRRSLEVLREPIESGSVNISRAKSRLVFPACFQLLAAINPCPCGYLGHPNIACSCTSQSVARYRKKLSGPLIDRFDLHVEVGFQPGNVVLAKRSGESSADVYSRVKAARKRQRTRQSCANSSLSGSDLEQHCALAPELSTMLELAMDKLSLSARGVHRVIRVARTLADLEGEETLQATHLQEALAYRGLDRGGLE